MCEDATFEVLGVRVDATQIPDVVRELKNWIVQGTASRWVAVTGMHGISVAQDDDGFKGILNSADLVVPDGMPLVWIGRRKGHQNLKRRVYGPELIEEFCSETESRFRHFFYGGAPGVADQLASMLGERYGIRTVGTLSPPYGTISQADREKVDSVLELASPDIVWVGLSTPKQERWMHIQSGRSNIPAFVGIGAAFDFLTGRKRSAPKWMKEHGLEWFFRLIQEPRRLWRRYLVGGLKFLVFLFLERFRIRRF